MVDLFGKGAIGLFGAVVGKSARQIERFAGFPESRSCQPSPNRQGIFMELPARPQPIAGIGIAPGALLVVHLGSLTVLQMIRLGL
jgi:hypothetical protein